MQAGAGSFWKIFEKNIDIMNMILYNLICSVGRWLFYNFDYYILLSLLSPISYYHQY